MCPEASGSWPVASVSEFGARPLLVDPDIAFDLDRRQMTRSGQ
jgi:hypothetical protein